MNKFNNVKDTIADKIVSGFELEEETQRDQFKDEITDALAHMDDYVQGLDDQITELQLQLAAKSAVVQPVFASAPTKGNGYNLFQAETLAQRLAERGEDAAKEFFKEKGGITGTWLIF